MAKAKKKPPAKTVAKKVAKKPAAKKPAAKKPAKPAKPDTKALANKIATLMSEAAVHAYANKIDAAMKCVDNARALATGKKLRAQIQTECQTQGNRLLWNQKWKHAIAFYEAGAAAFRDGDDTRLVAEMLNECGFGYLQLHQLDEAEQRIRRARELHEAAKRLEGVASTIYYQSSVVFERGNIEQAVELARLAVAKSVEGNDKRGEAFHSYALARALYERGQTREAEEIARKAIPLASSQYLGAVEGNLVNMVANVALDDHRLDEAEKQYVRAIELFKAAGLKNHEAITISNIGNIEWDRGRLEDALGRYQQAIKLHKKAKDDRSSAIGLTARAGVYTELGRYAEAQTDLEAALGIMMKIGHERRVSFVRAGLARLAETRGELEEARAHYAETEMSLESAGDAIEVGRMLYAASGVEAELGDPEAAAALLERAAALDPTSLSADGKGARAGIDAVRALRELAIARIEAARARRVSGDAAQALNAAARSRLEAVANAKDSLMQRSSEVRRVASRLAAQLGEGLAPKPTRYRGKAAGIGAWRKASFTGDLFLSSGTELTLTGTLDFELEPSGNTRRTNVSARGPRSGDKDYLTGTLTEVGGLGTMWNVRFEIELRDTTLHGRLVELDLDAGGADADMCAFKWRAVG